MNNLQQRPQSSVQRQFTMKNHVGLPPRQGSAQPYKSSDQLMKLNDFMDMDKRQMSQEKMNENYKINTWKSKFHYKQFNSNNLDSIFLDNNPEFIALKTMVDGYNDEILEAKKSKKEVRNAGFRNEFFNNLINIMREIVLTTNREVQEQFVTKTYNWVVDTLSKLDYSAPKDESMSSQTRPFSGAQSSSTQRPFSSNLGRSTSALLDKTRPKSSKLQTRPMSGYPHTQESQHNHFETMNLSFNSRPDSAKMKIIEEEEAAQEQLNELKMKEQQDQERKNPQPSDIIQQQLIDYKNGTRTLHQEYEPPGIRLGNYKRKRLPEIKQKEDDKQDQQEKFVFPKYPKEKIPLQYQQYYQQNFEQEEAVEVEEQQVEKEVQQEVKQEKQLLKPNVKEFLSDEQGRDNFKYDLNEEFEHRSTFSKYKPKNEVNEVKLADTYLKNREKEAREKREDQEMISMMNQWSQYKGRMEKEINRRVESATYGHRFQEVEMKQRQDKEQDKVDLDKIIKKHQEVLNRPKDFDEDLHLSDLSDEDLQINEHLILEDDIEGEIKMVKSKQRPQTAAPSRQVNLQQKIGMTQAVPVQKDYHELEKQMSQHKVLEIRKLHGNLVGLPTVQEEKIKREQEATERLAPTESLSIYASQKQFKNPVRPFSAALERENLNKVRQDTIKEINDVKLRMAQKNVNVGTKILMNAMLVPDELEHNNALLQQLPPTGYGVLDNPFEKKTKKKKKGGKKKKK